jgi:hypothetical protein
MHLKKIIKEGLAKKLLVNILDKNGGKWRPFQWQGNKGGGVTF